MGKKGGRFGGWVREESTLENSSGNHMAPRPQKSRLRAQSTPVPMTCIKPSVSGQGVPVPDTRYLAAPSVPGTIHAGRPTGADRAIAAEGCHRSHPRLRPGRSNLRCVERCQSVGRCPVRGLAEAGQACRALSLFGPFGKGALTFPTWRCSCASSFVASVPWREFPRGRSWRAPFSPCVPGITR